MEKIVREILPANLGRILEVGSLNINGSAREYFKGTEYIGIDMVEGKDVDIVLNGHDLTKQFLRHSFDTVVCMNTLEHDNWFWLTLQQISEVLKQGGYFIFASPTYDFPIHRHPKDYYRFLEDSVREVIFSGYEILDFAEVASKIVEGKEMNHILCGVGKKL